jgi:hypothetical protein
MMAFLYRNFCINVSQQLKARYVKIQNKPIVMKKFLFGLMALATLAMNSCSKSADNSIAADSPAAKAAGSYAGTFTINRTITTGSLNVTAMSNTRIKFTPAVTGASGYEINVTAATGTSNAIVDNNEQDIDFSITDVTVNGTTTKRVIVSTPTFGFAAN